MVGVQCPRDSSAGGLWDSHSGLVTVEGRQAGWRSECGAAALEGCVLASAPWHGRFLAKTIMLLAPWCAATAAASGFPNAVELLARGLAQGKPHCQS